MQVDAGRDLLSHQVDFLGVVRVPNAPLLSEVQTDILVSNLEQALGLNEDLNPPYDTGVDQFNNDEAMNQRKGATKQIARAVIGAVGETRKFVMDPVDFALLDSSKKLSLGRALHNATKLKKVPSCGVAYMAYLLYAVELVEKLGSMKGDELPSAATLHLLESLAYAPVQH
jgi:hypothetical protein